MELNNDLTATPIVIDGSVKRLTNPCYMNENPDPLYQHYYVYGGKCDKELPEGVTKYGDYDPKFSPNGEYIAFERHIGSASPPGDPDSDWDLIVVKMGPGGFQHDAPAYDETIWNVTHHFDGGHSYSWSTEFLPHWKLVGGPVYDLIYTVLAIRTPGDELDDFYDQFIQRVNLDIFYPEERYKRPKETPDRLDNFLDERGIWFPDGTELLFFRELGPPLNEVEQAKRLPARKW